MSMQKTIRYYFQCMANAGENMSFDLVKKNEDEIKIYHFDHRFYDGMSAMCEHLNQNYKENVKTLPEVRIIPSPSFFRRLYLLTRWWMKMAYRSYYVVRTKKYAKPQFDFRSIKVGKEKNLTAKISLALHRAFNTSKPSLWMLPVSVHEKVDLQMSPENKVSFIDLVICSEDTTASIQNKLEKELKLGTYWGTFLTMYAPQILGEKLFLKSLKYFAMALPRTGTLTNLGHWKISGIDPDEVWAIKATVVPINPIGASVLQVNEQLSIGLQIHGCLGMSPEEHQLILDRWQAHLVELLPN